MLSRCLVVSLSRCIVVSLHRCNVIHLENVRLETRKNFFNIRVAKEWNRIPDSVKQQQSVNAFKNAYDKWTKEVKNTN